jgi:phosphonate transport system permease protein
MGAGVLIAGLVCMADIGLLKVGVWGPAIANLVEFAGSLLPPNTEVLPTLVEAMLETIQIAFVGTLLGFAASLPLAFLGTRTLFGPAVTTSVRLLVGAIRTVPALLWGVVFVVGFGLGPAAGAMGVALYSIGYLAKLYYEAFEDVDPEVLEAVKATGARRPQLIVYAILPESTNAIISQVLFMFEYNVRASSIMGFVGAGGIGFYMLGYLQLLQYENLMTALLLTFVVVMAVDFLSARLRQVILPSLRQQTARAPLLSGLTTV